ncbi:uncharacterized protein DS421_3g84780 [Arachis hypogaea]|nr:uncharacterized protein DS421_3g84780 [Arachis hypogaea]
MKNQRRRAQRCVRIHRPACVRTAIRAKPRTRVSHFVRAARPFKHRLVCVRTTFRAYAQEGIFGRVCVRTHLCVCTGGHTCLH